jgi:two-component sensor histidine kinase
VKTQLGHIELYIAALNGADGELLTTGDARPVSLNRHLRRLMDKLKATYTCVAETVSFCVELEDVEVPAKIAMNVWLLVNEAVTNSFKHAVPRGAGGISLALRKASTQFSSLAMTVRALTAKQQHMRGAPC